MTALNIEQGFGFCGPDMLKEILSSSIFNIVLNTVYNQYTKGQKVKPKTITGYQGSTPQNIEYLGSQITKYNIS